MTNETERPAYRRKKEQARWLRRSADIASEIRHALRHAHMTQTELADRLKVSRQHVNKIMKGNENLTLETIARIEEVLGVILISVAESKSFEKIKPIVYHSFAEKRDIEKGLMSSMPRQRRKNAAVSLMKIFHASSRRPKTPRGKNPK